MKCVCGKERFKAGNMMFGNYVMWVCPDTLIHYRKGVIVNDVGGNTYISGLVWCKHAGLEWNRND